MTWRPPADDPSRPLRQNASVACWRSAIQIIADRHGLDSSELTPYEQGEAIVWQASNHVIKLTKPACLYQIEAEVGCLGATHGKLSVETPSLVAHGELSGWPYVVMGRIQGRHLADFWPKLDHREHCRLARAVGRLSSELHALPPAGFPADFHSFYRAHNANPRARHAAQGGPPALLDAIEPFLRRVMPSDPGPLVPLHTELSDLHVYAEERHGKLALSGLLDFVDARLGPAEYEYNCPVEFLFRNESCLLREFLLGAGIAETRLDPNYSETLLGWALCHRFSSLNRLLSRVAPWVPQSLEELAVRLFSVAR